MKKTPFTGFFKTAGTMAGITAVIVIVIAVNIIIRQANMRIDLTEEKLYTLSQGTKDLLTDLDRDVTIKFFFNSSSPDTPVPLKNFARQVEDLLKEYRITSKGRVKIETHDPTPDSDAEEWAQRYGLSGRHTGITGNPVYCGIVGTAGDTEAVMPALSPVRERQLEYDLTRMIAQLVNPEPRVIGVISSLPLFGTPDSQFPVQGRQTPPKQDPWFCFTDLQKDYDVRTIETDAEEIPEEINALIIVHPKNLPEETLYAIDQFLMRGGHILAFLDPFCIIDAMSADQQPYGMPDASSNMERLLSAWGVTFNAGKIVADMNAITRVMGPNNKIEENPAWLSLRKENVDPGDIVTSGIQSLLMAFTGSFEVDPETKLKTAALVKSSENSALINNMSAQFGLENIKRDFQSEHREITLALRLHGTFNTAFPEKETTDKEEKEEEAEEELENTTAHLASSATPGAVILVGDVDMLFDQFCIQESNFMGFRAFQPLNDNLIFFANAVEQITGSEGLIGIRSRGTTQRPFTKVLELQEEAQVKWLEEERMLEEKLNDLQVRLSKLQQASQDQGQRFILSPEQEREIRRFREEQAKTRDKLKEVRKNLRSDIERLGVKIKVINILLMPLLVALAGIAFGIYRKKRASAKTLQMEETQK